MKTNGRVLVSWWLPDHHRRYMAGCNLCGWVSRARVSSRAAACRISQAHQAHDHGGTS